MLESSSNQAANLPSAKNEMFSTIQVPQDTPFFVRLNGRRFQAVSDKLKAQKPFDGKFTRCLVLSGRAIFEEDLNPTLVYAASDELNVFFAYNAPFNRRVEKINSVLAGTVSSSFSLNVQKLFGKPLTVTFDSRIVISTKEKSALYLTRRQSDAWRNHNNSYAYWLLREIGQIPEKAARTLQGMKTEELHQLLFQHGVNLARTPAWQRRGVLVHKRPYQRTVGSHIVTRWRVRENWKLPMFSSAEGKALLQQILEWAKPHEEFEE